MHLILFVYIFYSMKNYQQMNDFLHRHSIFTDSEISTKTIKFIEDHVGDLTPKQEEYEILAATAIAGEAILYNGVASVKKDKQIVSLQHVMRRIGKLSKEKFLQVLTRQVTKWREAPHWLKVKTENIKFAYRVFKKYRSVFDELTLDNPNMEEGSRFNLMAIFWILYLFVKRQHAEFDNILDSTMILHAIILFFFSQVSAQMTHRESSIKFRKQFPQSKMPQQKKITQLIKLFTDKLNKVHQYRYRDTQINLQQLATDIDYIIRFLDDMSNIFERESQLQNGINQISFLELDKTLTPMTVKRPLQPAYECISQIINFQDSDEQQEGTKTKNQNNKNTHIEEQTIAINDHPFRRAPSKLQMSPFKPYVSNKGNATPVTARHQNLGWVNGITAKFSEIQANEVKRIYEKYTKKQYQAYQKLAFYKIHSAIDKFTSQCRDYEKRKRSIYHFFQHFVNQIAQKHTEIEIGSIFNQDTNFNSILCLSADLFNYAYHSLEGSYSDYCHIFSLSLVQGYKPINWFGNHVSMPKNLQTYLYDLERKILISQIWQNNQGYTLLTNEQEQKKYHSQALIKRLHKHANERTQQLCDKMIIQQKQIARIATLVKFILQKRAILLKNHKIDQIIVCSIASVLSINRSCSQFSLQQIFSHYNRMILSYYNIKTFLYDNEGNQIELVDFYNNIFLPSIEEIINNQDHTGILSTPIRLEVRKSKQLGIQLTPISRKFRQAPPFIAPMKKIKFSPIIPQKVQAEDDVQGLSQEEVAGNNSYRMLLANSLKNLGFEEEREDHPSPQFGGGKGQAIYRTYSFGDLNDKFE